MKRILLSLVLVFLFTSVILTGCGEETPAPTPAPAPAPAPTPAPTPTPAPAPADSIELKIAHHVAPMHQQHREVLEPYVAELAKRTEGRITAKIFPSETLGKRSENYDLVLKGTCDISWTTCGSMPGRFPLEDVFQLPFLIPGEDGDPAFEKISQVVYEKYLIPLYLNDVKVMWTGRFGLQDFMMVDKPVKTMEDFKGMVIGIPGGGISNKVISALGATPEWVPTPEQYTALERGVLDGTHMPMDALKAFKFDEVVNYILVGQLGSSSCMTIMRWETWNGLSPEDQKIMDDLNIWANDIQAKAWSGANKANLSIAEKAGIEISYLEPAEAARWLEATKDVDEEWIVEMKGQGLPVEEMVSEIKKITGE